MRRLDAGKIPETSEEIRLFLVVRNESLRLPFLLEHYAALGVDRVFVVDNDSTDGTRSLLLARPRVHVFSTAESYRDSHSGRRWMLELLNRYGRGCWCVIADADEILGYPHWDKLSLQQLCRFLDESRCDALRCHLLDMYSDRPIRETVYVKGEDPFEVCPFFDAEYEKVGGLFTEKSTGRSFRIDTHVGGMRRRVFGISPYCSKVPLLRYREEMNPAEGMHDVLGANFASIQGVVFHFKYFDGFVVKAPNEAEREQHWHLAAEYKVYAERLRESPDLCLLDINSHRYRDSLRLVDLGIMKSTPELERFVLAPAIA